MSDNLEMTKGLLRRNLGALTNGPGAVLYNGWNTLKPGKLYVIGFNPGGDPNDTKMTIESSVDELSPTHKAYTDECWGYGKGNAPHQKRVVEMTRILGQNADDVFAVNALFTRTVDAIGVNNPWTLWEKCWPVHQYFLSIVRPKIILCLGNSASLSSFRFLHFKLNCEQEIEFCCGSGSFRDGKVTKGTFQLGSNSKPLNTVLLGAPHPSRFPVTEKFREYVERRERENWTM